MRLPPPGNDLQTHALVVLALLLDLTRDRRKERPSPLKNYTQNALISVLLRVPSILPYGLVARLGEALGSLLYRIPGKRKHILHTNLRLCFPEQTDDQRDRKSVV